MLYCLYKYKRRCIMESSRKYKKSLKDPESVDHGYNYAIFLLGLSMRTENEMRRKMELRGYAAQVVENVIKQLYNEKLLDDRNYAEVYVRNLKQFRSLGFYGIKKKLMEKRLPTADIEDLLKSEITLEEELKLGKKFLGKEMKADYKKSLVTLENKQKLARKLQARGFRSDIIAKLLF